MMQRFVDNVLAITKESVKTLTYESLHNVVRLINGGSALLLTLLPGKATILEGVYGWELKRKVRGPRFPWWMESGVSSFNQFIHDLSVHSDGSSIGYSTGEDSDEICPASPSSQSSRVSWASASSKYERRGTGWVTNLHFWITLPAKCLILLPLQFFVLSFLRGLYIPIDSEMRKNNQLRKKVSLVKDHIVPSTTDKQRGIIEDLHLATEIFIETVFDFLHKVAHLLLSPSDACGIILRWFSSPSCYHKENYNYYLDDSVPTAFLEENHATPTERSCRWLNTDTRTCRDVITELGYPYEAIRVITSDGYVLVLERIPRRDSRKALYLQHGALDSSMGWVYNGCVASPAFAAYDLGFDVFLGNFRGLVSRDHVDKNISAHKYWAYSLNEHGIKDLPAMIDKIHQVKTTELKLSQPESEKNINNNNNNDKQPYRLCALSHSLGGAALLMYVITSRIQQKPHRLSRLVLLSPAGFHHDSTFIFTLVEHTSLLLAPILSLVPAWYIPTRFFRMLLNKLARDFHNYPAVGGLVQTLISYAFGGDTSNWVGVFGFPHYNMNDMPGISFRVVHHLSQMKRAGKFRMYDYGSAVANARVYGSAEPLDLGDNYGLIDVPVDLVSGRKDNIIRSSMVRKHYKVMKDAGVNVSFNEFDYAHLDFMFPHMDELLAYVISRVNYISKPTGYKSERFKDQRLATTTTTS